MTRDERDRAEATLLAVAADKLRKALAGAEGVRVNSTDFATVVVAGDDGLYVRDVADGRLMAAAPQMRDVLEAVLQWEEQLGDQLADKVELARGGLRRSVRDALRAAETTGADRVLHAGAGASARPVDAEWRSRAPTAEETRAHAVAHGTGDPGYGLWMRRRSFYADPMIVRVSAGSEAPSLYESGFQWRAISFDGEPVAWPRAALNAVASEEVPR